MTIAFAVTCFDVSRVSFQFDCTCRLCCGYVLRYIRIYVCIYIYILARAGTSDILTFVYTTGPFSLD